MAVYLKIFWQDQLSELDLKFFHHTVYNFQLQLQGDGSPKLPFLLMVAASDGGRRSREECEGVRGSDGWC